MNRLICKEGCCFFFCCLLFGLVREGKLVGWNRIEYMCVYIDFSGQNSIESKWIVFTLQVRSITPLLPGGSIRPPCREVEVVEVASLYGTERDKTTTGYRPVRECSRCKQGWSRAPGEILPTFIQQATTLPFTSLHFPPLMPFARYSIIFVITVCIIIIIIIVVASNLLFFLSFSTGRRFWVSYAPGVLVGVCV